jgi:hypothetical protein
VSPTGTVHSKTGAGVRQQIQATDLVGHSNMMGLESIVLNEKLRHSMSSRTSSRHKATTEKIMIYSLQEHVKKTH